jgi:hypothetical protein
MSKKEIKVLARTELDEAAWQQALPAGQGSRVYAQSWYLDIVSPEWKALVLGNYDAVMPLTAGKKYGVNYLYQPFFTQQLGVFGKDSSKEEVQRLMLEKAKDNYAYAEINLHQTPTELAFSFTIKERANYVLSLKEEIEVLRKNYADTLKRNIKKALKQGFVVEEMEDVPHFLNGYMKHTASKTKEIKASHKPMLKAIVTESLQRGAGRLRAVFDAGNCIAACFYLLDEERCVALMPWADEHAKKHGAAALLTDSTIEAMCGKRKYFDFEGSDIPGVATFYKQFGPEMCPYYAVKWNNLPAPIKWLKK